MKQTIKEHQENLAGIAKALEHQRSYVKTITAGLQRMERDFRFYERQVEVAGRKNMQGFNRDKFLK